MQNRGDSRLWRYGVAVLAIVLATVLRLLLDPVVGTRFPFATIFFGVLVAAHQGGFGPALLATLLGAIASMYFLLPPRHVFWVEGAENQGGLLLYLFVGLGIAILGGGMRRSKRRAERAERAERKEHEQLRITLASIGDAVISTDARGRVTFLNTVAQQLTGWSLNDACGVPLTEVFRIVNETTRKTVENPALRAMREGYIVGLANHTVLLAKDGREVPIEDSAAPIRGDEGIIGSVLVFRDVRERRQAEQAREVSRQELERLVEERTAQLRSSEERFRLIVEGTRDYALFVLDKDGYVATWNPGAERIKQYRADEIIGQHFSRFYPDEDRAAGKPSRGLEIALAEGRFEDEGWRVRKDGTRFWASVVITALRDASGNLRGFSKITRDLTDKREAEENARRLLEEAAARRAAEASEQALRQSEERLRLALEAGRMGVWDWNLLSNELQWSESLEPIHGLAAGTFGGTLEAFEELIHPGDRARVKRVIRQAIENKSGFEAEFRVVWPDSTVHWMLGKGKVFLDETGRAVRMIGIGLDVSERKRAEQTAHFLAGASASLNKLVDYESTLQSVASLAVPHFADWVAVDIREPSGGLKRVAVAHVDPSKMELARELHRRFPPRPNVGHGVWQILRTGKSELVQDITDELLQSATQSEEQLSILRQLGLRSYMGVPLDVRGKTMGVITFISSESGHRYDSIDLRVAEDLANRAAIAVENSELYRELRDADRRKDEFLATLAHELRNPLAPVRNGLQLLRMSGDDPTSIADTREIMERQIEQMVRLVDDLLDVSRITRNKIELRKQRVAMSSIVKNAVETARPLIDKSGHELEIVQGPEEIYVNVDPVRLAQVLSNLLNNSAKYTRPGGKISLTVRRSEEYVVVQVSDNGIGIPTEALPRIFEMFSQVDQNQERAQGGLGIGLTLVRRLVEMHGGTVEAHSAGRDRGSVFTVRLPIAAPESSGSVSDDDDRSTAPQPAKTAERRVLIIDDNADAAFTMGRMLTILGNATQTAHDGEEGLVVAEQFRPHVIFLDIGLPKLDGREVCRRLRQTPWGQSAVIIALTGWGQEEDRRRSVEAGFDQHLVKPIELAAVQALLEKLPASSPE